MCDVGTLTDSRSNKMLKVKEAAKELNVSMSWMDKMINQKLIKIICDP